MTGAFQMHGCRNVTGSNHCSAGNQDEVFDNYEFQFRSRSVCCSEHLKEGGELVLIKVSSPFKLHQRAAQLEELQ